MELDKLIEFAEAYSSLGNSVQEQLGDLLNGNYDDINPNAVKAIDERIASLHDDIQEAVNAYNEYLTESSD